ncbi:DMP19 family protein [Stieleria sp. JC731]|uniref:DMP19 family protein n=1 Tax=Pirellulaceae TaxID=2691357 RepID=UPI001E2D9E42|nr:DUF4375 domain-containing protein [Stieleria sp. JC731]MCC9600712.1 DMP19 family protein [Stieleria sp. JC731]
MNLPETVLKSYQNHFDQVRATIGSNLHDVLRAHDGKNDELMHLLARVVDWRICMNESLTEPDRFVAAFSGLRTDVQNGGFHQYFLNSAGDLWSDLLRMLILGGDHDGESHFRRVLDLFPESSPSTHQDTRAEQLDQIDERYMKSSTSPFDELNSEFYRSCFYPDEKTLIKALKSLDDIEFIPLHCGRGEAG